MKAYRVEFFKRAFFRYETGFDAAWVEVDEVSCEILDLEAKCKEFTDLANMFDFPEQVEAVAKDITVTKQELVMVKDVWDTSSLCELQFQVGICLLLERIVNCRSVSRRISCFKLCCYPLKLM